MLSQVFDTHVDMDMDVFQPCQRRRVRGSVVTDMVSVGSLVLEDDLDMVVSGHESSKSVAMSTFEWRERAGMCGVERGENVV